jgi:hypothetical protein
MPDVEAMPMPGGLAHTRPLARLDEPAAHGLRNGTEAARAPNRRSKMSLKQGFSYLGVLVVGVAGGWIAGLLTAPASGDETRRRLYWRLDEGRDRARREAQRVVEQTATRVERGIEAGKQKLEQSLSG